MARAHGPMRALLLLIPLSCGALTRLRRGLVVKGAASAATSLITVPLPSTADEFLPLVAAVVCHGTQDFYRWLDGVYLSHSPPAELVGCMQCAVGRVTGLQHPNVLTLLVFPADEMPKVKRFYTDTHPHWMDALETGSLVGPLHLHMFEVDLLRISAAEPQRFASEEPRLVGRKLDVRPGGGIMFGAHGLGVSFGLWASKFTSEAADIEHAGKGVTSSIAGKLLCSTDAPMPGPAVLHTTPTPSAALALANELSEGESGDPRVRTAIEYGLIRRPLYAVSAEVVRVDRGYGGDRSQRTGLAPWPKPLTASRYGSRSGLVVCCQRECGSREDGGSAAPSRGAPRLMHRLGRRAAITTPLVATTAAMAAASATAFDTGGPVDHDTTTASSSLTPTTLTTAHATGPVSSSTGGSPAEQRRCVYVAGATGRTGLRVIEVLERTPGVEVVAGVRGTSAQSRLPAGVDALVCDLTKSGAVSALSTELTARGVTDVVSTVGFSPTFVQDGTAAS